MSKKTSKFVNETVDSIEVETRYFNASNALDFEPLVSLTRLRDAEPEREVQQRILSKICNLVQIEVPHEVSQHTRFVPDLALLRGLRPTQDAQQHILKAVRNRIERSHLPLGWQWLELIRSVITLTSRYLLSTGTRLVVILCLVGVWSVGHFLPVSHEQVQLTANDTDGYDFPVDLVSAGGNTALVVARAKRQILIANDATSSFGFSVSVSGDTALIDAPIKSSFGSEYLFERASTSWTEQQRLVANGSIAEDVFGESVSIDDSIALIDAHFDDDNRDNLGSAYVFARGDTKWTEQQKLVANGSIAEDVFGESVSIDDSIALIGDYRDDDLTSLLGVSKSGSTYVFERSGTNWTQLPKLKAEDNSAGDLFGSSVSLDGDIAIIDSYALDDTCPSPQSCNDSGAAHTFVASEGRGGLDSGVAGTGAAGGGGMGAVVGEEAISVIKDPDVEVTSFYFCSMSLYQAFSHLGLEFIIGFLSLASLFWRRRKSIARC